jgi:hypothetical protein
VEAVLVLETMSAATSPVMKLSLDLCRACEQKNILHTSLQLTSCFGTDMIGQLQDINVNPT